MCINAANYEQKKEKEKIREREREKKRQKIPSARIGMCKMQIIYFIFTLI